MASSRASLGILMLIGLVIFGISLIVFAGAYGYQYILAEEINRPCQSGSDQGCGLRESLEHDKRELQVERIIRFARLDAKMKAAAGIINSHDTLLPLFDLIQSLTLQTIRYTKFDFSDKGILIEGVAVGYEDIAVQLKAFKESELVKSAVFSGLGLDQRGNVTFKLALSVDQDVLSYQTMMTDRQAVVAPAAPASTTATSSAPLATTTIAQ